MSSKLSEQNINDIVKEVSHSFAVENMVISERQKEEVKRALRGEISFSELTKSYINEFSKSLKVSANV